jgi:hypothetical protein
VLTVEGIRAHLERLSYKDGWSFDVYEGRWEGPHIVIRTTLEDALLALALTEGSNLKQEV